MALPGVSEPDEQDFPTRVIDSQSILPFFAGGESQLAVTAVPDDLVLVSTLRRFETRLFVAEGTHTPAGTSATVLTDSTGDFLNWGVEVGDTINNTTDGSSGVIIALTATTITVTALAGGTGDDFEQDDVYDVSKTLSHQNSKAATIRKIRITTDLDCYIEFDGEADSASHIVRLNAGESLSEDHIRIVSRISFINVTGSERPTLRWYVFGI